MNLILKAGIVILISSLTAIACSSDPVPKRDPYNDADSQRSRASQSQGELSRDTK